MANHTSISKHRVITPLAYASFMPTVTFAQVVEIVCIGQAECAQLRDSDASVAASLRTGEQDSDVWSQGAACPASRRDGVKTLR